MNQTKTQNTIKILIFSIWKKITRKRKIQLLLSLLLMLLSAFSDLISLASVFPLLAVLSQPDQLLLNPTLIDFWPKIGITNQNSLILFCAVLFIIAAIFSSLVRLGNLWVNGMLASAIGSDLSSQAYLLTLHAPYEEHINQNSSRLVSTTATFVNQTISVIKSFLQLFTGLIIATVLIIAITLTSYRISIGLAVVLGGSYVLIFNIAKRRLSKISMLMAHKNQELIKILQESLGSIRDIIINQNQLVYFNIYSNSDRILRRNQAKASFLGGFPRFAMEGIGLIFIGVLSYILTIILADSVYILAVLGTFAVAAQRLLPAMQLVYVSWAGIKSASAGAITLLRIIEDNLKYTPQELDEHPGTLFSGFSLLELKDVSFTYSSSKDSVLNNLTLSIRSGEKLGLIGKTGSGKSTLIDLILGLLSPTKGSLLVNNIDLHSHSEKSYLRNWQASISHVPQSIFLSDSTIAENIAFGLELADIDWIRLELACKKSQLLDFIDSLPNGFQEIVGERGVKLSGGQRQRIGIARCLYKNSQIIILDEATSALDNETEAKVMETIYNDIDQTVIMIAHRLSTLSQCDRIMHLQSGKISKITTKDCRN